MIDLPFDEHETAARARLLAMRLATSTLPIFITGEPGTGRRTLARDVAESRAARSDVIELHSGGEPPTTPVADQTVLAHHVELLDASNQVRLAACCASGARVVAWGAITFLEAAHPELRAHIGNAVVELPPLRERGADAAAWARLFLARHAPSAPPLGADVERAIAAHPWPGNLTQLEGTIVRALALRDPGEMRPVTIEELALDASLAEIVPLGEAVERFRREYILQAIERCGGNRTQAAKALHVDPRTVFRYLERAGD